MKPMVRKTSYLMGRLAGRGSPRNSYCTNMHSELDRQAALFGI